MQLVNVHRLAFRIVLLEVERHVDSSRRSVAAGYSEIVTAFGKAVYGLGV
jgi:hypothetical protein